MLFCGLVTILVISTCDAQLWNSIQDKVGSLVKSTENAGDEIELDDTDTGVARKDTAGVADDEVKVSDDIIDVEDITEAVSLSYNNFLLTSH